jgi:hypothetical protein
MQTLGLYLQLDTHPCGKRNTWNSPNDNPQSGDSNKVWTMNLHKSYPVFTFNYPDTAVRKNRFRCIVFPLWNIFWFFTCGCCILLRIYLTGSLWRRQSQQSFNILTLFNFLFYSLHVSAPTGHPQARYTVSYLKDCFNTTDLLHVCNLI